MAEPVTPVEQLATLASFEYAQDLRDAFRGGQLIDEWAARYPDLFHPIDVNTAKNQAARGYHFVEWFSAVRLFEDLGLASLHEGYTYKSHLTKRARLLEIAGEPVHDALRAVPRADQYRFPDLFVYRPGTSDWFFVEVKGPGDSLSATQAPFFSTLVERVGRPVKLVTVRAPPVATPTPGLKRG